MHVYRCKFRCRALAAAFADRRQHAAGNATAML
jgi:hypothetical protein